MFEELYEKLPDRDAYLARIGLPGLRPDGSLETLNKILYAHVHAVPFENLDAWAAGRVPSLGVRDLYEKVVVRRRGGWCHELNALLQAFLEALGYEAWSVGGRVQTKGYTAPIGHHGVVCALDGKRYYCDVGFGDIAFQSAISLDGTPSPFGFHIEKNGDWYDIWQDGDQPRRLISFAELAYEPVDYLFANRVSATDPDEFFKRMLYVSIMRGDQRLLLRGSRLTAQGPDGEKELLAETEDPAELTALLKEWFGLDYPLARGI